MLKVQIKSKENIKPSSPTSPNHPPIQLSSLDHISPPIYTHILLFYSSTTRSTTINPNHLKTSLSTTLLHFSPLAGRIHRSSSDGILYVHCTDEGAVFIEAEVHQANYNLQSFLTADHHAPIDEFPELLPIKKDHFNLLSAEEPLLAVQLTVFDSGGYVLGLSMCHLIADGASMALFLKQWSSISRSSGAINGLLPNFDSASLFSPQPWSASTVEKAQDDEHVHDEKNTITITKVSIKRFVIDKEGIERLRVNKQGWRPTRVQAVCGLVWRCLRRAKLAGNHVSQVVNIRKKKTNMVSMLSEKDFGNLWVSVMVSTSDQCEEEALGEAVTSVNEEYVRNFIEGKVKKNDACWIFTSWCRMGFYESSDFGWGEPEWVGCGLREMKDVCMLIDAKDGVGVEVWVWLDVDGMEKLENDLEFLSFVSF